MEQPLSSKIEVGTAFHFRKELELMEKNPNNYIFSTTTGEVNSEEDFNVDIYEFNPEICCEGTTCRQLKNFDDLISLLEEWEDEKNVED